MTDDEMNGAAWFTPQGSGDAPYVEIGGVQVYVYFKDGELNISVDCEDAYPWVLVDGDRVPTRFLMNGVTTRLG